MHSHDIQRVVVVGGGVSGLATAFYLRRANVDVTVLEASPRLGGNLRTQRRDGYLIDDGADSWVAAKPHASELARELGLGDRLIETNVDNRRVYVAMKDGALVPLPAGLVLGVPTQLSSLLTTPLLTARGKARALLDLILPVGFGRRVRDDEDESVGAYLGRRLGREVVDALAGPLLGGLYAGDVSRLSLGATFPQLAALERRGGLIRAVRAMTKSRARGVAQSTFVTLRGGVGELIDALENKLQNAIARGAPVRSIERVGARFAVHVDGRDPLDASQVVIAGPAHVAATLLRPLDEPIARELESIPYASSATVFLAFDRKDVHRSLDATGYIAPSSMRKVALASTWVSSKWAERAPADRVLLRVFFGGATLEGDDATLIEHARDEVQRTLSITAAPLFSHVARFHRASPQPEVGHPARIARVRARLSAIPGVHLLGSAYDGVGISDCVRQAQAIARAIAPA